LLYFSPPLPDKVKNFVQIQHYILEYLKKQVLFRLKVYVLNNFQEKPVYQVALPVVLDISKVAKIMPPGRVGDRLGNIAQEMAETARKVARPRGMYQVSHPRIVDNATVDIDGVTFKSKVLNKLLKGRDVVYPFIVTIGKELDELPIPPQEMMKSFTLDSIKTLVLVNAVDWLTDYIKEKYNMPKAALLNPGEIEDWHITEQKPLFSLFKDPEKLIGVSLTAGGVMKPIKSRSGFIFANETGFKSCQLCTQLKCPGRRAKYDPELQKQYLA
jgi:hypothetical protein